LQLPGVYRGALQTGLWFLFYIYLEFSGYPKEAMIKKYYEKLGTGGSCL
jgi:hypothetical protein